jgi:histidine ammonia-lyase
MGWHAARKAAEVLENVAMVIAVEVLCAAQAIDLRAAVAAPGPAAAAVHAAVREVIEPMDTDREVTGQILAVRRLLPAFVDVAEQVTGPLS